MPAALGNGDDLGRNLYWDAAFGVRTLFKESAEWKEVATVRNPNSGVLERTVFVHRSRGTYLVADAYRGRNIKQSIADFYRSAAGIRTEQMLPDTGMKEGAVSFYGSAERVCGARWVDGLYDREQISERKAVPA